MNVKEIKPERRLRLLGTYMNLWVDKWPHKPKPFDIWLESQFDSRSYRGQMSAKEKHRSKCRYCQRLFDAYVEKTKDHVVAQSIGGKNVAENKVPCCWDCNQWKDDKTLDQWLKELKKLAKQQKGRPPFILSQIGLIIGNIKVVMNEAKKNQSKISTYKL